jgi:hypothetical protein
VHPQLPTPPSLALALPCLLVRPHPPLLSPPPTLLATLLLFLMQGVPFHRVGFTTTPTGYKAWRMASPLSVTATFSTTTRPSQCILGMWCAACLETTLWPQFTARAQFHPLYLRMGRLRDYGIVKNAHMGAGGPIKKWRPPTLPTTAYLLRLLEAHGAQGTTMTWEALPMVTTM